MVARILRHARSNAVAYAALFVALGGTSYAAIKLPANSVGTKQIKKSAVTRAKLKPNAVDSSRVANGSLLAGDFKAGQLPAGPAGPQGPKGDPGQKGDPGDPAQLANGSVGPSKFAVLPRARVNNYANPQAIPNDTETPIQFTVEEEDTDGMVDLTADNATVTIRRRASTCSTGRSRGWRTTPAAAPVASRSTTAATTEASSLSRLFRATTPGRRQPGSSGS